MFNNRKTLLQVDFIFVIPCSNTTGGTCILYESKSTTDKVKSYSKENLNKANALGIEIRKFKFDVLSVTKL